MRLVHSALIPFVILACSTKQPEPAKASAPTPAATTKAPEPETAAPPTTTPAEPDVAAAPVEEVAAAPETLEAPADIAAAPEDIAMPSEEIAMPTEANPTADDIPRVAAFPDVALSAEVGQWVFTATRASLDEAKKDPDFRAPSYTQMELTEIGPKTSKAKVDYGDPEAIVNAYTIVIPKTETVAVGDVVLASRYGNDMQLAIVTEAGDAPKADFVEAMPYDEDHIGTLKPGRFIKLDGTLKPGAHAAVKNGAERTFAIVVAISGDKVLLAGHMGTVIVASKADVTPLEVNLPLAVGDTVAARFASGSIKSAKVTKVDAKAHVVWVDFTDLPDPKPSPHPTVHLTKR